MLSATVWASNLLFIVNYLEGISHQFDGYRIAGSFLIVFSGTTISVWISHARRSRAKQIACGGVFGFASAVTLSYLYSAVEAQISLQLSWRGMLLSVLASSACGVLATLLLRMKSTSWGWKAAIPAIIAVILIPQHIAHSFLVSTTRDYASSGLQIGPDFVVVLVIATLAVGLLWSLAAFVAETHENRVRKALLKDATLLDPLTELPNRLRLEQHFAALKDNGQRRYIHPAAVLLFNIDGFKIINETHGSSFGDHCIKEIAYRLSLYIGPNTFVARLGGDEFIMVLNKVHDVDGVKQFAEEVLDRLTQPVSIPQVLIRPSVRIGYGLLPQDSSSFDDLIVKAEVAATAAKSEKLSRIMRYNREMNQQERERSSLLQDLRNAIDRGELFLNFQMQHEISTEDLVGFEVLLRWKHPEKGMISPVDFIPLAESSGLIRSIGMWVLEESCKEAASWHRPYSVAVNVAPQQLLEAGFCEAVEGILDKTGLPANQLELEITEASIIEDEENTLGVMHRLRKMGIKIAMDDFGTGYSSLAMLQAFPFDKIKIDRSFVIDVHENPERAAIIQATVLIGEAMAIPVLVEGVEQREELAFLRRAKCHIVQGYIFGKPLDVEEVRELALIPDKYRMVFS